MPFDLSNGFSALGEAVSKTAGAYALEAQKADAQKEMLTLADQLAGVREEKGRTFQTSERVATQAFTAGENTENRKSALGIAQLQADAAVKSAGIHAGATIGAAQIGAATSTANNRATLEANAADTDKRLAANKPLVDAEVLQKNITTASAQMVQDARKELQEARATNDPTKIKAAQQKEYDASYSSQAQVQQVSLYQAQAKIAESAMNFIQGKIASLQASSMGISPETQATIKQLQNQLKQRESEFNAAMRTADDAIKSLPAYTPPGGAGTSAPPLSSFFKAPAAPSGAAPPPAGMIDSGIPQ